MNNRRSSPFDDETNFKSFEESDVEDHSSRWTDGDPCDFSDLTSLVYYVELLFKSSCQENFRKNPRADRMNIHVLRGIRQLAS